MSTQKNSNHYTLKEGYNGILSLMAPIRNPKVCNGWLATTDEMKTEKDPNIRDIINNEVEATGRNYSVPTIDRITAVT